MLANGLHRVGVVALLAVAVLADYGVAVSSSGPLDPSEAGDQAGQDRTTALLGYQIGEERRYVLGPPDALRRGESGSWAIRLQEVYDEGTPAAEAVFELGHAWSAPLETRAVPYRWINAVQGDALLRVNPYGFPLLIQLSTQRSVAGLGQEAYTIDYVYGAGIYEKLTTMMGALWRDPVDLRGHEHLDEEIPAGLFAFFPSAPGCLDRRLIRFEQENIVQLPERRSAANPSPMSSRDIAMPMRSEVIDNADCEESLFINPGLLSLAMPAFWEANGNREFLFFTPIGPVQDDGTDLRGIFAGGSQGVMRGLPRVLGSPVTVGSYYETELLRVSRERAFIQVGDREVEAWRIDGLKRLAAIYVDDNGVDLPREDEQQPQRWIRMLWPSEF